jgi:hypothetical protein
MPEKSPGWYYFSREKRGGHNGFWRGLVVQFLKVAWLISIIPAIPNHVLTHLIDIIDNEEP